MEREYLLMQMVINLKEFGKLEKEGEMGLLLIIKVVNM